MIVVCGEALVDLTPVEHDGERLYRPSPGGGPRNTAVALARLGADVRFLGRLSVDPFGTALRSGLVAAGVDDRWVTAASEPTTMAIVSLDDDGQPRFSFYADGTADRLLVPGDLPPSLEGAVALHLGTLSLVLEPAASTLESLMVREAGRRVIMIDPNVRPAVLGDRDRYRARLHRWLGWCDVVKVSDADLAWIDPDVDQAELCAGWVDATPGPTLVVLTRGGDGASGFFPGGRVDVPAPAVHVADTVGAGDAFSAGLLVELARRGCLDRGRLAEIDAADLTAALAFAVTVAAITCTRPGADPPTAADVASWNG